MFFKFSFLLLSFIIAANFVLGESEDENEILKDSFDHCRMWLRQSRNSTISLAQFWLYIGKYKYDLVIIHDYLYNNPTAYEKQDRIDFDLYSQLFKLVCSEIDYTVKVCAEVRKIIALTRTPEEVASFMENDD